MITKKSRPPYLRRNAAALLAGCVLLASAFLLAGSLPAPASAAQDDFSRVLRVGFLTNVFHDIDPRDALAATELMAREMARNAGFSSSPRVVIYPDLASMAGAVRRGEFDIVTMPSIDYLRIRDSVPLTPAFVGSHNNGMGTRFVLIVRKDAGIDSFSGLRGKSISVLPPTKHEPSHIWLDVLLMKAGKKDAKAFFRKVRESSKVSHAIMGVFFRQVDAAIVTRAGFDASRLLNPQIEREVTVLAESRYISDGVTCFPATISDKLKAALTSAIIRLNQSPSGRQLYTIYQTTGTTPFKPSCLAGLEELLRENDRLRGRSAKRK